MKASEVADRARSAIAKGCLYGLGKGGMRPHDSVPWDSAHRCDCSGFAAWCLKVSRETDDPWYVATNGGWLETTAIVRDCETPYGHFAIVMPRDARPGDLLVYGDQKRADGITRQGHVGIVSETGKDGPSKVVHCSRGNERKTGDAIQESGVTWWKLADGIVARCAWVEQ